MDPQAAWAEIGGADDIVSVERLKRNNRTNVYRLVRPAPQPNVIAKRCREPVALCEDLVYSSLNGRDELRLPTLYGMFADPESHDDFNYYWLFLEDLGANRHDPSSSVERDKLSAWLGTLGRLTVGVEASAGGTILVRDLGYYATFLRQALADLPGVFAGRDFSAETQQTYDVSIRTLATVERHWPEIESLTESVPSIIVHGDCLPKNIHVTDDPSQAVVPIDWGAAGLGLPGFDLGVSSISFEHTDLFLPNVDAYASAIAPAWPDVDATRVFALAMLGRILWTSKLLAQSVPVFREHAKRKVETYFQLYTRFLNDSVARLGWSAPS